MKKVKSNNKMQAFIIENHDEAYRIWKNSKIVGAILCHIDAHIDYDNLDNKFITIGNYIGFAIKENIVDVVVWVLPTPSFENKHMFSEICESLEEKFDFVVEKNEYIEFNIKSYKEKKIFITSLQHLSKIFKNFYKKREILVDIDIDFFMNPYANMIYSHHLNGEKCWISCRKVYKKIKKFVYASSIVTISKSILGGYTPLIYSFLANEMYDLINEKKSNYLKYTIIRKAVFCSSNHIDLSIENLKNVLKKYENDISVLCGLVYCYAKVENYHEANKWLKVLISYYPQYEPYIFPIDAVFKNNKKINYTDKLESTLKYIDLWLTIDNNSNQANLYKLKMCLYGSFIINFSLKDFLNIVNEKASLFEKSYLLSKYYLKLNRLDDSICASKNVVDYLSHNDTPIWVGQISSYEKRKNAGIVIAQMLENIAICYSQKGETQLARKYALMCKKINYVTFNTNKILLDSN